MAIQITINGTNYDLPLQGENPPWGSNLSDIIEALSTASNSLLSPTDIQLTSFNLTNNQSLASNVNGLSFDTTQVRSAIITYSVYISTNTNELTECGTIYASYKNTANTWEIAQANQGDSGIIFSVLSSGQFQYTSTNISGTSYSGTLKFRAQTFSQ